jgi:hypothetical protein
VASPQISELATDDWPLTTDNYKLATDNWQLTTGNYKLETGNWKLETILYLFPCPFPVVTGVRPL